MSDYEPTEPYIIQNGALYPANDYARAGRVWKVVVPGGSPSACIENLTRWEAEKIVDALRGENHRARIAELEADKEALWDQLKGRDDTLDEMLKRLALAEKVCEAVLPDHQWSTGDILDETTCPICVAVAAWREGK